MLFLTLGCRSLGEYVYITGPADHVSTPTSFVPSRRADPGTNNSPPPSDLAISLLERGGRRALLSSSCSLAATPHECGGSHTLSSSSVHSAAVRAKEWQGAGGSREGRRHTILTGWETSLEAGEFSYYSKSSSTSGYSTLKYESCNTKEELGTTRG